MWKKKRNIFYVTLHAWSKVTSADFFFPLLHRAVKASKYKQKYKKTMTKWKRNLRYFCSGVLFFVFFFFLKVLSFNFALRIHNHFIYFLISQKVKQHYNLLSHTHIPSQLSKGHEIFLFCSSLTSDVLQTCICGTWDLFLTLTIWK